MRVLITVDGGVVQSVSSDSPQVFVFLRDWDDAECTGETNPAAVQLHCDRITSQQMDSKLIQE
jgi:hypothetical protein